jgi:hypothetical protein
MATKQSSDTNKQGRKDQQQEANLGQKEARGKGEEIRTLKFGRKFREIQLRPPLPHSAISSRVEQGRARRPAHRLGEAVSPVRGKPYLASPLCGRRFCRALYFFSAPGPVRTALPLTRRPSMTRDSPRSLRGARLPCAAATVRPVPPAGPPRYPSRHPSSWRHWGPVHLSAIHAAHPRRR